MPNLNGPTSMERLADRGRACFVDHFDRTPIEAADEVLAAALTISVGTPTTVIPDVGGAFNQATLNNIVASLGAQINNLRSSLINRGDMLPVLNLAGTNIANATIARYDKGGFLATTHTVLNSQVLPTPALGRALAVGYSSSRSPYYSLLIDKQASVAEMRFKAGLALTNAVDTTTDPDQAFFFYDSSVSENWRVGVSIAGIDVIRDTEVPFASTQLALIEIEVGEDRVPRFYLTLDNSIRFEVGRNATASTQFFGALTADVQLLPQQGHQTLANPGSSALAYMGLSCGLSAANN